MSFQLSLSTEAVTGAYPDEPLMVDPESSVGDALQLLRAQSTGSVLVCEGSNLVGIFTERDALKLMASEADFDQPVSQVMSTDPVSLSAESNVGEAIKMMSEGGYRHLPILSGEGEPTGMATVFGIINYLVDHFPQTIYTLPPSPDSTPSDREGA